MLFNSYHFIFLFFPLFLIIFFIIKSSKVLKKFFFFNTLIVIFSLFFYAYYDLKYLYILFFNILVNFYLGNLIIINNNNKFYLCLGIIFNIFFLFYYKYLTVTLNFIGLNIINYNSIIIPLGVSFFTFQQISYLIEISNNTKKKINFYEYVSFILFFPKLISGPILKINEYYPKIYQVFKKKYLYSNLIIGLAIFFVGLSKKLLIADQIALHIDPFFLINENKIELNVIESWLGPIGYIFQLYFDFSGYSDMAVGLCRIIGLDIPYNFLSPLKKTSLKNFWSVWHITLTRFTTEYIFSPLTYYLNSIKINFRISIIISSIFTFLLIGIWHGAGINFLVFGIIHGLGYQINIFYNFLVNYYKIYFLKHKFMEAIYWAITFVVVVISFVFFRSPNLDTSLNIIKNMFNFSNLVLPTFFYNVSFLIILVNNFFFQIAPFEIFTDKYYFYLILIAFIIVLFFPNTKTISIILDKNINKNSFTLKECFLSILTIIFFSFLILASLFSLNNSRTFLYYQF
jgi:D-alanyl-lipoteichoic acid acyltransferase DltB (MBOAT superfamily)